MNPVIPGILAAALYAASAWLQIRAYLDRNLNPPALIRYLSIPAIALHAGSVYMIMVTPQGINLGIFVVLSLTGLIMALVVFLASLRLPLNNLSMLAFPIAILGIAASLLLSSDYKPSSQISAGLLSHILSSIFAYTILLMAAGQAVVLSALENFLNRKASIGLLRLLPPLETMEQSLFALLRAGVALLTVSLASGMVFLENMFAQHVVHHTILSIASWLVFVGLLAGRHMLGWRGRVAVRWTLSGFTLLLLAYFGSKFVLEVVIGN